jgi:hypothetical protein
LKIKTAEMKEAKMDLSSPLTALLKKAVIIICCLVIVRSTAFADSHNPNGSDWNNWEKDMEIGYVHGFTHGANTMFIGIFIIGETPNRNLAGYVITGMTLGQLIDGIDILYSDFKNRSVSLDHAIYVVYKQIKGTSQDDIEKILLWLRSGGKWENKDKFLTLKDTEGKVIKTISFP